jgi:multiple sugar transport system permease protein
MGKEANKKLITVIVHAVLILMTIVMLVPFIWMVLTSFKTVSETTQVDPFVIFPSVWRTAAFEAVFEKLNFVLLYKNTLLLIFFRVVCACLTATMAGYAFGRLNFKGRNFLFS